MIRKGNVYTPRKDGGSKYEAFEDIIDSGGLLIERIISSGQSTPEGTWLEQERDEWVILLRGKASLSFHDGSIIDLEAGDYVFIPRSTKHRVESTSSEPECTWLAVHGDMGGDASNETGEEISNL